MIVQTNTNAKWTGDFTLLLIFFSAKHKANFFWTFHCSNFFVHYIWMYACKFVKCTYYIYIYDCMYLVHFSAAIFYAKRYSICRFPLLPDTEPMQKARIIINTLPPPLRHHRPLPIVRAGIAFSLEFQISFPKFTYFLWALWRGCGCKFTAFVLTCTLLTHIVRRLISAAIRFIYIK